MLRSFPGVPVLSQEIKAALCANDRETGTQRNLCRAEGGFVMVRVEKNGRSGPDPEVPEKAQRRRFTAEYKLKILRLADECARTGGEVGELLRKEDSILRTSRIGDGSARTGLAPKTRGRKPKRKDAVTEENERLRRDNARLQQRLVQVEAIIDVQKKLSISLGIELPTQEKNEESE
jgi:transposase